MALFNFRSKTSAAPVTPGAQVEAFLQGYSIEVMPRTVEKIEDFRTLLPTGTRVYIAHIDIFDREAVFIDRILSKLVRDFPALKIVLEHITTEEAANFVAEGPATLAATITPHHLDYNPNAMFKGGIRPHFYCLPVAKREHHRLALRKAATSGSPKFFLGTDSAPHAVSAKETACGRAGVFYAPHALESYAKVFDEENALARLEAFASENGPRFYGLPLKKTG